MKHAALVMSIALFFSGCGPGGPALHPVAGKLTVDGKPAEHALVFMHRKGRNELTEPLPYGKVKADGSFEVDTPTIGKGAQEGDYMLTVYWPDMSKPEGGDGERPDALFGAYDKLANSKLSATVKSGKNEIPAIDLKHGTPKPKTPADQNLK